MLIKSLILTRSFVLLVFLAGFVPSCGPGKPGGTEEMTRSGQGGEDPKGRAKKLEITAPANGSRFQAGEPVIISFRTEGKAETPDSVVGYADGRRLEVVAAENNTITWETLGEKLGSRRLAVRVYHSGRVSQEGQLRVVLLADSPPLQYGYRVVRTFPHDQNAYTQGLIYDGGYFYESTGQYGESSLRKVKPETAEIINMLRLDDDLFGEGICLFNDRIIQLTWTSRVGFVYDKETFRLLNKIHYPNQGWGITTDGRELIMSDGTQNLYYLEPDYFTELHRVEVYDDKNEVRDLNELEYIKGEVWANVYMTDKIVRIDPLTGQLLGVVDLTGLLPARYHHPKLDVLNGIAWDEENDRLFVTGKMWPLIFEIELVER